MMRDSDRYLAQAETVMRMAVRASSPAERQVYETIAEGWRKLAGEARRNERRDEPPDEPQDEPGRRPGPGRDPFRQAGRG
jgi:hypothetical protein